MFLSCDFGISNRILSLHPRIRPWKLPFHFCLTLKMLQHSAWRKFLALLSCFLTLKPSWFLKHLSESILKITSDWDRAQKPLLFSCFHLICIQISFFFFFFSRNKHFFWSSLGVPLGWCSQCLPGTPHHKLLQWPLQKKTKKKRDAFSLYKNKSEHGIYISLAFIRVIHNLGEQVKFHCRPGEGFFHNL